jgi:hypothetical protein
MRAYTHTAGTLCQHPDNVSTHSSRDVARWDSLKATAYLSCTSVTKPLEAQTCCCALSSRFQKPLDGCGVARHRTGCRLALQWQHIWWYNPRYLDTVVFLLRLRQQGNRQETWRPPRRVSGQTNRLEVLNYTGTGRQGATYRVWLGGRGGAARRSGHAGHGRERRGLVGLEGLNRRPCLAWFARCGTRSVYPGRRRPWCL